jgi:cell fate (sporulation/competence/biofilm development) regulator YlbF (YheA/YmcA/DUF963 family)
VSPSVNGAYAGYEIDAERFPKTAAFRQRVLSHPSVAKVLEAEQAMIKSFAA